MAAAKRYQIRVQGHLSPQWADWFDGITLENLPNGQALLTGSFPDQPALFGILTRIHSLNLPLLSVSRLEEDPEVE